MLRVRFPNGQVVQYNDANHLTHGADVWHLWKKTGEQKEWVASIPPSTGCIVERVMPCSVSNPIAELTDRKALERVLERLRSYSGYEEGGMLAKLKMALKDFNSTKRAWKA